METDLTFWVYVARLLKMNGFSNHAIRETIRELGYEKSRRAVTDAINLTTFFSSELPDGYLEFCSTTFFDDPPTKFHKPTIKELWEMTKPLVEEKRGGISPDSAIIVEGYLSETPQNETDGFAEPAGNYSDEALDNFSFWAGDKYKDGLHRYLDYEKRSNDAESRLDYGD